MAIDGEQSGPFGMKEIRELIAGGMLTEETLVWKDGMKGWESANTVPDLADLFTNDEGPTPPPLF